MQKWGQHFLVDTQYIRKIRDAARVSMDDAVLEIGSGKGALALELCNHVKKLLAVEIDSHLCKRLASKKKNNISIINENFLNILEDDINASLGPSWKIIANIPYYITSPILQKIYSWHGWHTAVLTVQKEVGERICARPGTKTYGLLSLLTHIHAEPTLVCVIPRNAFHPVPKVDSAVIRLMRREEPVVKEAELETFFSFLKICFSARRKMIINTITRGLKREKQDVEKSLQKAGIEPSQRPETVSLDQYILLHNIL